MGIEYTAPITNNASLIYTAVNGFFARSAEYEIVSSVFPSSVKVRITDIPQRGTWPEDACVYIDQNVHIVFYNGNAYQRNTTIDGIISVLAKEGVFTSFEEL